MTIEKGNLKTFKSDTMGDTPDGGGEITSQEVQRGVANNIFEDVSSGDRTTGGVKLRKLFQHVTSQNRDVYLSGRAVLTQIPADDKVGITAFTTNDNHDRREEARSRIESYRSKGSKYIGFLFSTQYAGSKVITIFQSVLADIPQIADVLYLSQNSDTENQYVKLVNIEESIQTFTRVEAGSTKTFQRRIIEAEISQQLKYDFVGSDIEESDDINPEATILNTIVADAAKYYSARPLSVAADDTDTTVQVDTIYSQLVPSGLREDGTASVDPITFAQIVTPANTAPVSVSTSVLLQPTSSVALGSPVVPGTLAVNIGTVTLTDRGGLIIENGTEVGSIDYVSGVIVFNADSSNYSGTKVFTFEPGAKTVGSTDTAMIEVTSANRGNVYTLTAIPPGQPGTTVVQFISLGSWYTMTDNGDGELLATQDGIGSGTIDYVTGSIIINLDVLPDEGGAVVFTWGTGSATADASDSDIQVDPFEFVLNHIPATVNLSWNDGGTRSATATNGVISGHATGQVIGKRIQFSPTRLPPKGTVVTATTTGMVIETVLTNVTNSSGVLSGNIATSDDIIPGTLAFNWYLDLGSLFVGSHARWIGTNGVPPDSTMRAYDDGSGNIIRAMDGVTIGTVDYVSGAVSFDAKVSVSAMQLDGESHGVHYTDGIVTRRVVRPGQALVSDVVFNPHPLITAVEFDYAVSNTTDPYSNTVTIDQYTISLNQPASSIVAPRSLRFAFGGRNYITNADDDTIESNFNISTRDGVNSGAVDRSNGLATITDWNDISSDVDPVLQAMASYKELSAVSQLVMRIPNPPVRTESFQLRVVDNETGAIYVADADANGDVIGTSILGTINYETGLVEVRFGTMVSSSGQSGEWWYDAADVVGGQIFKPTLIDSTNIRYDAVVQKFIPLDETVIGMNPVRLPEDGRVPIYNNGDSVFIMNTQEQTQIFTSSTQTNLGRTDLALIVITDANDDLVPATAFTADTDAGTIDWGDLTGLAQPLTVMHRIESERILEDVQITGVLTLNSPLTRDFPLAGTIVTSAILHGDMVSSVSSPFSQKTWTSEWSDIRIGDDILPKYNDANYPILVDNQNAVSERWRIIFTSSNTVNVVGEHRGVVLENVSISGAIAPGNPATGFPYFTIPAGGWGLGWASGNVMAFETTGAYRPIWIIESIGQGEATDTSDDALKFCLEFKGDKNTV